jgi:hypothetical protein
LSTDDWEQLGRDVAKCNRLEKFHIGGGHIGDHKMSSLFRGWARSNSIKEMGLYENGLSIAGVRSMVPFLQNANSLRGFNISDNNIQSEGFNVLLRTLSDNPVEELTCVSCGIESIEIDNDYFPKQLKSLSLYGNSINADGCRGLAKLLHGEHATMTDLQLGNNKIGDEGVGILANALQRNTSLIHLDLCSNDLSREGEILLLKLVNDISSIEATLQTNHTLFTLHVCIHTEEIQQRINYAVGFSCNRRKVIHTQLHSMRRADLCRLQGIERSNAALYSELDPLCLPEVLALVGRTHGLAELHVALKSSIATLFSTSDRMKCLEQEMAYHEARIASIQAEIAAIKRAKGDELVVGNDSRNKRRRI